MKFTNFLLYSLAAGAANSAQSVQGVVDLVKRRLPDHVDDFVFALRNHSHSFHSNSSTPPNDEYTVLTNNVDRISIEGNSISALSTGLRRYLTDFVHVDIYWYVGSQLHLAPKKLPRPSVPLKGSSTVPWRYHFNTVTFSYTSAWWSWKDWELQLDWMALHGVNLPLAWTGFEKILVEVFQDIGINDGDILAFLSGPAFQAWNRFGNIQGSWGGELPMSWIEGQSELQKKILKRMVELGMMPVLPAFTGFVPSALHRARPDAATVNGSRWENFPIEYTNVTFLEPEDPLFSELQTSFIKKQTQAYGNISHIYTLDQFNENDPASGNTAYLRNVSYSTWKSLKAADTSAIWMLQGWLFFSSEEFWTNDRVEAFLSGVEDDGDMLILDLFSESQPQWQRTNSYYGKPWIWCQLHNYGGNMGLYGQVENITINPVAALANSSSLIGFGLTMEGQENENQIMYDLLLDQAWSTNSIDTDCYFHNWVKNRYSYSKSVPAPLYAAWNLMRTTVYNNTNLTAAPAVTKSIFELRPNITGLVNRTGHHPTGITYEPSTLVSAWTFLYNASTADASLWNNTAYQYDLVDVTRQVMANAFVPTYVEFVAAYTSNASLISAGEKMLSLLTSLDAVLSTKPAFRLSTWLDAAATWSDENTAGFYAYNARNQLTLWGPEGEIGDYASKQWGGLVGSYYVPRWRIFVDYLTEIGPATYNSTALKGELLAFEEGWQVGVAEEEKGSGSLEEVLGRVLEEWEGVFRV